MSIEDLVMICIGLALTVLLGAALTVELSRLAHQVRQDQHPLARGKATDPRA